MRESDSGCTQLMRLRLCTTAPVVPCCPPRALPVGDEHSGWVGVLRIRCGQHAAAGLGAWYTVHPPSFSLTHMLCWWAGGGAAGEEEPRPLHRHPRGGGPVCAPQGARGLRVWFGRGGWTAQRLRATGATLRAWWKCPGVRGELAGAGGRKGSEVKRCTALPVAQDGVSVGSAQCERQTSCQQALSHAVPQVGPRCCLNPVKIFEGSFGGATLYDNPTYTSPNAVRAARKVRALVEPEHRGGTGCQGGHGRQPRLSGRMHAPVVLLNAACVRGILASTAQQQVGGGGLLGHRKGLPLLSYTRAPVPSLVPPTLLQHAAVAGMYHGKLVSHTSAHD